jgi:hypothetical protein
MTPRHIVYVVGAGLTKALEQLPYRVPLMQDFVSILADHLDDDAILTHFAEMESEGLFAASTPTTATLGKQLANKIRRTPAAIAEFKELLQRRTPENIETLLQ